MLDDRYGPNGDLRRPVGRKVISDYIGGMVSITMLVGTVSIIAGILIFSAAFPSPTRTAQYNHLRRTLPAQAPPTIVDVPQTQ
jgi:hypothetical protein